MSGFGEPLLTATPIPDLATTRLVPATAFPSFTRRSMPDVGLTTTSPVSPSAIRLLIAPPGASTRSILGPPASNFGFSSCHNSMNAKVLITFRRAAAATPAGTTSGKPAHAIRVRELLTVSSLVNSARLHSSPLPGVPLSWRSAPVAVSRSLPVRNHCGVPWRDSSSQERETMSVGVSALNPFKTLIAAAALVALAGCAAMNPPAAGKRELMIVGLDEKQSWDESGKAVIGPPGRDSVAIFDVGTDPLAPKALVVLPLANTIVGPPVNLAITPDESLALVANSMNVVQEGGAWKQVPDNRIWVIDLTVNPPKLIDTIAAGRQPSGMSINRAGNLALVANRADGSISVLRISGKKVELIDTVTIGEQVAHVVFTPDGRRALAAKFPGHKIAFLEVNGDKVSYNKQDVPAGLWPYNVDVTPDGRLALTADNGNSGAADGHVDTVSVIDLEATPPRVIDKVVVGDAPEGFAISPTGKLAVAVLLRGTNASKSAFFYNRNALVVALKIDGKKVKRTNEVEVRGLPEGVVFSDDGRYIYVGNFIDQDISILRVDGDQIVSTGRSLQLPGHPASMRGRTR